MDRKLVISLLATITLVIMLLFTCGSCPCSGCFHLFLYENGTVVKEFDNVTSLYSSEGSTSFYYQKQKYRIRMDFIAEPIPQESGKQ